MSNNKTTDYLQADEQWWKKAIAQPDGEPTHGTLEFDNSSATLGIAVYVPVVDPETDKVIGVSKAVVKKDRKK